MKAITLYQPYASALFLRLPDGQRLKSIETRSWSTYYRGSLLIHAAKSFPKWAKDFAMTERALGRIPGQLPFGCLLGIVQLSGIRLFGLPGEDEISPIEKLYGDYSFGRWGWITKDPQLFEEPIPYRGQQGIFNVPDELTRRSAMSDEGTKLAAPSCSASFALHASAPAGMKCADCTIDQTPCQECIMVALMELKSEMDWLDHHCSFVADYPYCLGPFKIGELRLLAKAGLAADKQNGMELSGA